MGEKKVLTAACCTVALTVALCLFLYHFDNKYTMPGVQPINGVLYLSEEQLTKPTALIHEWEFYPDVQLAPGDAATWDGYHRYADVGGKDGMHHGDGSYRLTLLLPETPQNYGLELPEIFSACRLYVNGTERLQLGDPSTQREGIASRMVAFPAAGEVELLLTVRDQSGVYSGLTYPPIFGLAEDVTQARELRLLLHGAGFLLALLGAALSLAFGWSGNRRRGLLFLLCCLCFCVITGYPLLHGLFVVSYQPWYTIEAACLYGLLLLAVLLCCDLYGHSAAVTAGLAAPCGLGLLLAIARTAGAAVWSNQAGLLFSGLSLFLKLYAALCLLGLSLRALKKGQKFSPLLLCGMLALAVCLSFDRLFPLYEPLYGGWFGEVGATLLIGSLAMAVWWDVLEAYRFRLSYESELTQLESRLALQKSHYGNLSRQIEQARESAHDQRHHLRVLRAMAEQGRQDKLLAYLDDYALHLPDREVTVYAEHIVADAVLSDYARQLKELGAVCDIRFAIPADLSFPDDELCILLGNLLENATEALCRQREGQRRLRLQGDVSNRRLRLLMENSFGGDLRMRNAHYLSSKHSGVGLGLQSIQTIAQKYGGLADFSVEGTVFRSSVMLPLPVPPPPDAAHL